ncbi:hypothetical protein, partial [Aquabacterium sp.]|uniref:hypothetical protein n=1 Tax=Aquabacterium sp. TaxID=1872578 RepID=UPI00403816DA
LHGLQNLQESVGPVFVSLQISHHTSAEIALQINGLRVVQGGLMSFVFHRWVVRREVSAILAACPSMMEQMFIPARHTLIALECTPVGQFFRHRGR